MVDFAGEAMTWADPDATGPQHVYHLRQMVAQLPIPAAFVKGKHFELNQAAAKLMRRDPETVSNIDAWFDLSYGENSAAVRKSYQSNRDSGFVTANRRDIICGDGIMRRVEFAGYRYADAEVWIITEVTEREQVRQQLERRERYLRALNQANLILLKPSRTLPLQEFVNCLGPASNASRVYIFFNQKNDAGQLCTSQQAEWCAEGVESFLDDPGMQMMSWDEGFPRFKNILAGGGVINSRIADLDDSERPLLQAQAILSILLIPLIVDGRFEGYIGFDNCVSDRLWESSEAAFLTGAATGLANMLRRHWTEIALEKYLSRLAVIHRIEHAILSAQSPDAVAAATLANLREVIPHQWSAVWLVVGSETSGQCRLLAGDGDNNPIETGAFYGLEDFCIDSWEPGTVVHRADASPGAKSSHLEGLLRETGLREWLHAPMYAGGRPMAILSLGGADGAFDDPGQEETLAEIANSLAIALHQCELNERIRRDNETRAVLMREVNHRVKNNLASLIGMLSSEKDKSAYKNDPAVRQMVDELIHRVGGLATLHAMFSAAQWQPLPIGELCQRMIRASLRDMPGEKHVEIKVRAVEYRVPPDQAHILALILNELATNSRKYGLQQHFVIDVSVERDEKGLVLIYRDGGPGFPQELLDGKIKPDGIGFDLIRGLARRNLHGTVSMRNENGAVTEIVFPAAAPPPQRRNPNVG